MPEPTGAPATTPPASDPGELGNPFSAPARPAATPAAETPVREVRRYSPNERKAEQAAVWGDLAAGRAGDNSPPATATSPGQSDPKPVTASIETDKDGTPRIKIGDFSLTESELRDVVAHKAEADLAKATRPAAPTDYKVELPSDLTLPDGVKFELRPDDPAHAPQIEAAREFAHRAGMSQDNFSRMLGLWAVANAREQSMIATAAKAEREKLGVTGPTRIDAISRWIRAEFGDEVARPVLATMATAKQVEFYETVMKKLTSQGTAPFSQQHRDRDDGSGRVAGYDGMTYEQRRLAQDQQAARRGR